MTARTLTDRVSSSTAVLAVGLIADVSAVVPLLTSESFRRWLKTHWWIPTIVSIVLLSMLIYLMNNHLRQLDKITQLQEQLQEPSSHDISRFQKVIATIPPDSYTIQWLKTGFIPSRFEGGDVDPLLALLTQCELDPRGFDDQQLNHAYQEFVRTLDEFITTTAHELTSDYANGRRVLQMPDRHEFASPDLYDQAVNKVNSARGELIRSYDNFLIVAQKAKVREYSSPRIYRTR
ncbi:hypothetical protein ACFW9F_02125 [Streptomyces sp. NPDC059506]|uniref:hypothetical protein n=1 Tax=unclassified Streptomyces TaxID=2593676 RepID=UPI0015F7BBBA|nr:MULTISPECIES: hypothetical protein [unclassified Streptomyces]MCZ2526014.1 hypothetical protein [Streptomyces sp. HB2AG]QMV22997.1 hypothetical protein GQS52_15805 [Streptomyces sp. SCUT-3]